MSDMAICCEGLSKRYRIGERQRYKALRDTLTDAIYAPTRRLRSMFNGSANATVAIADSTFWAIKDISFEVEHGEAVGIIGHNGAGKSTLLKILSRITKPSEGEARINGRVGSLLEVGTGFHPELTGRDNIYLNGAILGMKKAEIRRKFDEIVAFAEIDKFIDTPVKRYSSGMYVRLAFAVAAHLEPEVLIVDEVLAVGDASFQKKCLGKMGDVANKGRTVLFVSHNMSAIQRLCARTMLLEGGRLTTYGNTADVVSSYLANGVSEAAPVSWINVAQASRSGTGEARFLAVHYSSLNEAIGFRPYTNGPLEFSLTVESDALRSVEGISVFLSDKYGTRLVNADSAFIGRSVNLHKGLNVVLLKIKELYLNPGMYAIGLWLGNNMGANLDYIESAFQIEVVNLESEGFGIRSNEDGVVTCHFDISVTN